MAFVEENIRIDIDLTPLECDAATMRSRSSVALGLVHYPPVTNGNCETTGLLVYLKSSVSELRQSDLAMWEDVVIKVRNCVPGVFQQQTGDDMHCCSGHDWHIPAHVENYNRKNVEFPHEGTGDQFYDPEQFEAYRALGEHIGRQAARALGYLAPAAGS